MHPHAFSLESSFTEFDTLQNKIVAASAVRIVLCAECMKQAGTMLQSGPKPPYTACRPDM